MRFSFSAIAAQQNVSALSGAQASRAAFWNQTFSDWICQIRQIRRRRRPRNAPQHVLIVGLDVANGWLTLAWRYADKNRRNDDLPVLEGVRAVRLPEDMNWTTPGCVGWIRKELSRSLTDADIQNSNTQLWLRLDEKQDETRHYVIPKIRQKDRDSMALLLAHKEKPFDETTCLFDYHAGKAFTDKNATRIPVTALIASEKTVTALHEQTAGLPLTGITSTPISIQNLYASGWLAHPWEQFAFVEMGEDSIRILLFSQNEIHRNRTTRPGWNCLADALQNDISERPATDMPALSLRPARTLANNDAGLYESIQTSDKARERLFRTERSPVEETELLASLEVPLRRLKQKLEETLYAASETGQPAIEGIVLSTPRYCASLLRTTFETLGLPCRFFRYEGAATPQARADLEHALATTPEAHLTRAIGLCLSGNGRTPNLLMTPQKRHVLRQQTQIARLSLAGMFMLTAAIGLGSLYSYQHLLTLRQEKTALQTRLANGDLSATSENVRTAHRFARQRHVDMRRVEKRRLTAALISELAACTPETITLSRMSGAFQVDLPEQITASTPPLSRTESTSASPTADNAVVVIRGRISGTVLQRESRLAEYLNRLGRSPLILSMQIEKQPEDAETISFIATLTLVSL